MSREDSAQGWSGRDQGKNRLAYRSESLSWISTRMLLAAEVN